MASAEPTETYRTIAKVLAQKLDADIVFFNGDVGRQEAADLIDLCCARCRRPNVMLIMVTYGGDPDGAYQIARFLQRNYERFILFVPGVCKSAGTLVAIGAHELIMGHHGELGPIDIQMPKMGEAQQWQSGLDVSTTLAELYEWAIGNFIDSAVEISNEEDLSVPLKMAMDSAGFLTTGLISKLYSQIDPLQLGEVARAMDITTQYGTQLLENGANIHADALEHMTTAYPSHSFVIDRWEAETLFHDVRPPSDLESKLVLELAERAIFPVPQDEASILQFLSPERDSTQPNNSVQEREAYESTGEEIRGSAETDQETEHQAPAGGENPEQGTEEEVRIRSSGY